MGEGKGHSRRFRISIRGVVVLFFLILAFVFIARLPILSKAAAVNAKADSSGQWSQYVSWHQSWHYNEMSDEVAATCEP
jgi:hypothetical protein